MADLRNRYSFNEEEGDASGEEVTDSVGGQNGVVVTGTGDAEFSGTMLSLPGGPSIEAPYVDLPNGLISGLDDASFELWVTVDGSWTWSRIFDFGSNNPGGDNGEITDVGEDNGGNGEASDAFFLSAQIGDDIDQQRVSFYNQDPAGGAGGFDLDVSSLTDFGTEYHIVITVDVTEGEPSVTSYIKDGTTLGSARTAARLRDINDVNVWLGRSNWTADQNFEGTYNEFRIYDHVLTPVEIAANKAAGPDSDPTLDTDGDTITDVIEELYDLDSNDAADADADKDGDTVSNKIEVANGTSVIEADTDGDTLSDGVETNTGSWVSETDTGTNPLIRDTDGDGLNDSVETNTGTFVDAGNTGTDPNKADTDGDTWSDADEIALGGDPSDPVVTPAADDWVEAVQADEPVYWWRFEGTDVSSAVPNEGSANDFAGDYGEEFSNSDLGKPSADPSLGNAIEFTGPPQGGQTSQKFVDFGDVIPELINIRGAEEEKSTTVEYWIKTSQIGSSGAQTWVSPALLGHESPADGDMYWGWFTDTGDFGFSTSDITEIYSERDAGYEVTDDKWHHIMLVKEWYLDQPSISRMFIDGGAGAGGATIERETATGNASFQDEDGGIRYLGITEFGGGGDGQYIGLIDELAIYDRALTEGDARIHYSSAIDDSDGDGMDDGYEIANGLDPLVDDAEADLDSDGASNILEFTNGTDPGKPDTDEDGLLDGVETNTGTWVSAQDTGTDPKSPDSDGDGLSDGSETNTGTFVDVNNTGTNPLTLDYDEDTWGDAGEISEGSDPTDADSAPQAKAWASEIADANPVYWWRFEETSVDQVAINDGSGDGFSGTFSERFEDSHLGLESATPALGNAIEFIGPAPDLIPDEASYVDFGEPIPELVNFRTEPEEKSTSVEYWIKTSQTGSAANETWNSPSVFGHESPADGDMYWGWISASGDFGFSTSDLVEIGAERDAGYEVTDDEWHHVVLVKEWRLQEQSTSAMYIDGGFEQGGATIVSATAPGSGSQQDEDSVIQFLGFTEAGGNADVQFIGLLDEVAIYNRALTPTEARLHFLGSQIGGAPSSGFRITDVEYDLPNNQFQLTWQSLPGRIYAVQRSTSLTGDWEEVDDGVASAGSETSYTATNPAGSEFLYYRIVEVPL